MAESAKKKPIYKKWWFWVLAVVVIIIAANSGKKTGNAPNTAAPGGTTAPGGAATPAPTAPAKAPPANKPTMSKAEFDQLQSGMTYDEVTKIVGGPGEVLSESGKKGGTGLDIHTVMYQYKGEGDLGANASLMFQDEKLINKSQFGLK